MRLGIDFGTTRTVVAAAMDGRYPTATFDTASGYRTWLPGYCAWDGEAHRFADEAEPILKRAPSSGIRSLKRALSVLAPNARVPDLAGPPIDAISLMSGFLAHLERSIRARSNLEIAPDEPLEAMVAVPANASSRQRFTTLEAFRRAGFVVLGMLNEPSAAAIEYAHRDLKVISARSPKRYVVVYDLGGGTFDSSAVSLEGRRFDLLCSEGIGQLGGDDFDDAILACWSEAIDTPVPSSHRAVLLEACREAKESLTTRSRRLLLDPPANVPDFEGCVISVAEVDARCAPLVASTMTLLDEVFARLPGDLDASDARQLGALYLVGGAVNFPSVLRMLRERHGRKVVLAPEAHAATAVGLAIAADPAAEVRVREATTRYFGVWREGQAGTETIFDPLLRKDQRPSGDEPLIVERIYRPQHTIGHLRFVECTRLDAQGRPSGDLAPFAELYFPYDPSLADREDLASVPVERRAELAHQQIRERYVYERDGTIAVKIENLTQRYTRDVTLFAS